MKPADFIRKIFKHSLRFSYRFQMPLAIAALVFITFGIIETVHYFGLPVLAVEGKGQVEIREISLSLKNSVIHNSDMVALWLNRHSDSDASPPYLHSDSAYKVYLLSESLSPLYGYSDPDILDLLKSADPQLFFSSDNVMQMHAWKGRNYIFNKKTVSGKTVYILGLMNFESDRLFVLNFRDKILNLLLYCFILFFLVFLYLSYTCFRQIEAIRDQMNTVKQTGLIKVNRKLQTHNELGQLYRSFLQFVKTIRKLQSQQKKKLDYKRKVLEFKYKISLNFIDNLNENGISNLLSLVVKETGSDLGIIIFLDDDRISNYHFYSTDENQRFILPDETALRSWKNNKNFFVPGKSQSLIKEQVYEHESILGKITFNQSVTGLLRSHGKTFGILQLGNLQYSGDYKRHNLRQFDEVCSQITPIIKIILERTQTDDIKRKSELALRKSEEKYRTLFEESKDLIFSMDSDGVIRDINPAGYTLLGYKDSSEVIGRNLLEMYSNQEEVAYYYQQMNRNRFIKDHEVLLNLDNKEQIYGLETSVAIVDGRGDITGFRGTIKDITELIKKSRELRILNGELEKSNEELKETQLQIIQNEKMASIGQLAAGVAHEINNPLGFVKSNFTVLKDYITEISGYIDESKSTFTELYTSKKIDFIMDDLTVLLDENEEGFKRIMSIVQNLKDFSRVDALEKFEKVEINKLIQSTLVVARNEYKYVAEVKTDFSDIPRVECHANQISQVLLNIIVNAAHAIGEKGQNSDHGLISISTSLRGQNIIITIEDNGPGISEEHVSSIFNPFFTTKPVGQGTGLGLSISYDIIVNKHNGIISAENKPEGGTIFHIELPEVFQDKNSREIIEEIEEIEE